MNNLTTRIKVMTTFGTLSLLTDLPAMAKTGLCSA